MPMLTLDRPILNLSPLLGIFYYTPGESGVQKIDIGPVEALRIGDEVLLCWPKEPNKPQSVLIPADTQIQADKRNGDSLEKTFVEGIVYYYNFSDTSWYPH